MLISACVNTSYILLFTEKGKKKIHTSNALNSKVIPTSVKLQILAKVVGTTGAAAQVPEVFRSP